MTRTKALDRIVKAARMNGFKVEANNWAMHGMTIKAENVNFTIVSEPHLNLGERTVTEKWSLQASVSKMGGAPTVAELREAADEISRAALLTEQVNNWNLESTDAI